MALQAQTPPRLRLAITVALSKTKKPWIAIGGAYDAAKFGATTIRE
jgi:hypothetical protein